MEERLARGDKGINGLDEFCKDHDIAYSKHKDSSERYKADQKLKEGAISRMFSKDASLGERAASLLVSTAMKAKTGLSKFGMGMAHSKRQKKAKKPKKTAKRKCSKKIAFSALVKDAKNGIKKAKAQTVGAAIVAALRSAKKSRKGKTVTMPRVIKVPSFSGGVLPILPILAGVSAAGNIYSTVSSIVKTLRNIRSGKENIHHSQGGEQKVGSGLYLGVQKRGIGMYLRPHSKNFN